jgi:hypothetical protein
MIRAQGCDAARCPAVPRRKARTILIFQIVAGEASMDMQSAVYIKRGSGHKT